MEIRELYQEQYSEVRSQNPEGKDRTRRRIVRVHADKRKAGRELAPPGFLLSSVFWILNSGFWILASGFWLLTSRLLS
jgi:hypothetical protein